MTFFYCRDWARSENVEEFYFGNEQKNRQRRKVQQPKGYKMQEHQTLLSIPLSRVAIFEKKVYSLQQPCSLSQTNLVLFQPIFASTIKKKKKTLHKLLFMPTENYIIHRDVYLLFFWEWLNMRFMSKTFYFLEHCR